MATVKTVQAEASLIEQFKIQGKVRDHEFYADQPTHAGGNNAGPTPVEYTLFSLAACVVTVAQVIAKQERIKLRKIEVKAEGEVDVDVFMGKGTENRAGFMSIRVITKLDADLSLEEKKTFLEKVDRRCPVSDNLKDLTAVSYQIVEE